MSEVERETPLPVAKTSRMLAITVLLLLLLPVLLPGLLHQLELQWMGPRIQEQWQECASITCPGGIYWDRLAWLFVLGPSVLLAGASILLGTIGLFRARRHPTSSPNQMWFAASVTIGSIWALLSGCFLWYGLASAGTLL